MVERVLAMVGYQSKRSIPLSDFEALADQLAGVKISAEILRTAS